MLHTFCVRFEQMYVGSSFSPTQLAQYHCDHIQSKIVPNLQYAYISYSTSTTIIFLVSPRSTITGSIMYFSLHAFFFFLQASASSAMPIFLFLSTSLKWLNHIQTSFAVNKHLSAASPVNLYWCHCVTFRKKIFWHTWWRIYSLFTSLVLVVSTNAVV